MSVLDSARDPSESAPVVVSSLVGRHLKRATQVVCLLCLIFVVGAILAFPETEDGRLLLAIKDAGSKGIWGWYSNHPIIAWTWSILNEICGVYLWPVAIALNYLLWAAFGFLASWLWTTLFPESSGYAPLVGCLTISPAVLHVQTTTLTVSFIAILPSVLGYASCILLLQFIRDGSRRLLAAGLVLIASACLLSEYGACAALVTLGLLSTQAEPQAVKRAKTTVWLVIVTSGVMFLLFLLTRKAVPDARVSLIDASTRTQALITFPLTILSQAWHSAVGAYGTLLGNVDLLWRSSLLLLASLFGIVFGWFLTSYISEPNTEILSRRAPLARLALTLIAGLFPTALIHPYWLSPNVRESEFASRLLVGVMPIAACLTTLLLLVVVRQKLRIFVVYALGLLMGESLISQLIATHARQQTLAYVGASLRPYVNAMGANVVGVLSTEDLCFVGSSCTAKASVYWPPELTKRFWLYKPSEALEVLGRRSDCQVMTGIKSEVRSARGSVTTDNLLWVQVAGGKSSVEPYCFTDTPSKLTAHSVGKGEPSQTEPSSVPGLLQGSVSMPSGLQNLTQLGVADWAHFRVPYYDHKAAVKSMINFYTVIGVKTASYHSDHPFGFSWNDGDPNAKVDDIRTGIFVSGRGKGLQFDVYPDIKERTLLVYVGVWKSHGKLVAHLSDNSAPDYVDTSLKNDTGTSTGLYKITFRTGSLNQRLVITFSQIDNGPGLVALQAAALSGQPLK